MPITGTKKYQKVGDKILRELSFSEDKSYHEKSLLVSNILKSAFEHDIANSNIIKILEKMEHTEMSGISLITTIKRMMSND